ncbi:hypothetical protein WOC76_14635 [Methylocystis sp. IM3]|uniref:hypothetical protein n=1 Tax=unclassified Methylocystis TaxID=2625913 RepID=UPI0030FB535B
MSVTTSSWTPAPGSGSCGPNIRRKASSTAGFIDEASPLHGWTAQDFAESDASLILIFEGHDETASQTLRARRDYPIADALYGRDYVDIMDLSETGLVSIDYSRFHDTREAAQPLA